VRLPSQARACPRSIRIDGWAIAERGRGRAYDRAPHRATFPFYNGTG